MNSDATVALLEATFKFPFVAKFVYISRKTNLDGTIGEQMASVTDGYTQTKPVGRAVAQACPPK